MGKKQDGLKAQVQAQTQQIVLTWLLALSQDNTANYQVKAICFDRLNSLKAYAKQQATANIALRAHYLYAVERIEKPKDIELPQHREIAPGAPIGCDWE